jgi:hypothetical protein
MQSDLKKSRPLGRDFLFFGFKKGKEDAYNSLPR